MYLEIDSGDLRQTDDEIKMWRWTKWVLINLMTVQLTKEVKVNISHDYRTHN